jgi:GDP-4-dehydro-6-deoxy-D-mannose reductase
VKIVVTGATGFIGSHMARRLVARGDEVCAWIRPDRDVPEGLLAEGSIAYEVSLTNAGSVRAALEHFRPDAIFHFAAQSRPMLSWEHPWETLKTNIAGATNLFEAARELRLTGPIVIAGASGEYGPQRHPSAPIGENHPLSPSNPYEVSKIAADQLAQLYHKRSGLAIMRARPFFWIGARKTGDFCSDVAQRLAAIEEGGAPSLKVGNLDAVRDLLDVHDGIEALLRVLEKGQPGEAYNICSGVGYRLRDVLDLFLRMSKVRDIRVEVDPSLLRAQDEAVRVGDPRKIMALGWRPTRALDETVKDILHYWRGGDAA